MKHKWIQHSFYLLLVIIFSVCLSYFYSHLMLIPFELDHLPLYFLWTLFWVILFTLLRRFPIQLLISFTILGLIIFFNIEDVWQWLLEHQGNLLNQINVLLGYGKLRPDLPLTPLEPYHYVFVFTLVSVLILWISNQSLISIILLIAPLFFIEHIEALNWFIPLILGLFVSLAYYNRNKKLIPNIPVLLSIMVTLLLLNLVTTPQTLFYYPLNNYINRDNTIASNSLISGFDLSQVGYNPGNAQVGGPVTINNNPFMIVQGATQSFYLKGSSFKRFENDTWIKENPNEQPFNDFFASSEVYNPITDIFKFGEYWNYRNHIEPAILTIQPIFKPIQTYFHGTELFMIDSEHDLINVNDYGVVTSPSPIEEPYTILTSVNTANDFNSEFFVSNTLERVSEPNYHYRDSGVLSSDDPLYHLVYNQLDNHLTGENILEVINHLRSYDYSLNVEHIPNYRDNTPYFSNFLKKFYETKVGYCVYFATSLTLLLQDLGLEARYVEGFVVPTPTVSSSNRDTVVLNSQAHAWTELYLPGYGWMILDATPSVHTDQLATTEIEDTTPNTPIDDEITPDIPEPPNNPEPPQSPNEPTQPDEIEEVKEFSPLWLVGVLMILLGLIGYYRIHQYQQKMNPITLKNRIKNNEKDTIRELYKDILSMYRMNQSVIINNNSVYFTLSKIMEFYGLHDTRQLRVSSRAINDALYGFKPSHPVAIDTLIALYQKIETASKESTNKLKFFLLRILFHK